MNGSDCKFMKMPKGCKFTHAPMLVAEPNPVTTRDVLGAQVYSEIVSALNQANCTEECHARNVGGRMTGVFLDIFSPDELSNLLTKPTEFATYMMSAFEIFESNDKTTYIRG